VKTVVFFEIMPTNTKNAKDCAANNFSLKKTSKQARVKEQFLREYGKI
jgi:hypothetical protein